MLKFILLAFVFAIIIWIIFPIGNSVQWKVKAGNHYHSGLSSRLPKLHFGKSEIKIRFRFDPSCLYDFDEINDKERDYNKLYGIGYGFNHQKNSYRIGWRPTVDLKQIEIASYMYKDGVRKFEPIGIVDVDKWQDFSANLKTGKGTINGEAFSFAYTFKSRLGFMLSLYFGGNAPAPHDVVVDLFL